MATTSRGRRRPLSRDQRLQILEQLASGATTEEAARASFCSPRTVFRVLDRFGGMPPRRRRRAPLRLSLREREQISVGLATGKQLRVIACELGRAASTISREVKANGGRGRYRAIDAEQRALALTPRPKPGKLARCPELRREVERGLAKCWSPQQISARLRVRHPDDPSMRVSHETIYRSLYVQSRGELRRQLARNLRSGRTQRRTRQTRGKAPKIKDLVSISERPAEVADRAVPGHWEGDLLVGAAGRSFVATLVERQTRYVMLARLGSQRNSAHVVDALKAQITRLPDHLTRSLTWDRGTELAEHARFSVETGLEVFFCDPHSPWQRGSNENTNGLLRQYLPKGADLAARSQVELDRIAAELNDRPRQTLAWMTPAEKMAQLLR